MALTNEDIDSSTNHADFIIHWVFWLYHKLEQENMARHLTCKGMGADSLHLLLVFAIVGTSDVFGLPE
jgi:hypothetical protein